MKTFQQIGTAAGALVEEKNRAYGSSFSTAGAAMRLLYPNGIAPEQMQDALVLVRIWDKLMRIATDRDALGESPYNDIIGYGILGVHMHQAAEGEPQAPCGSVSAEDAAKKSQAQSDSALPSAPHSTTPNESGPSASDSATPSQQPSSSTSASTGALAQTARVAAVFGSASESRSPETEGHVERRSWILQHALEANQRNACALCGCELKISEDLMYLNTEFGELAFHSDICHQNMCSRLLGASA